MESSAAPLHRVSAQPWARESGDGEVVLCIHAFSSSASQYEGLMQRLSRRYCVVAVDLYGHGRRAAWSGGPGFRMADEAQAIEALLPYRDPVHLVGHSYGAAVALRIAATSRLRVRSLTLYEPTMWGTLAQQHPGDPATVEIEGLRSQTLRLIADGRLEAAAERFIDYWAGAGAWAATPAERRPRLIATMRALPAAWEATFAERWSAPALRRLNLPCLLMGGTRSPASARRAMQLLRSCLPNARSVEFDYLGHLGPITHAARIDATVDAFLSNLQEETFA